MLIEERPSGKSVLAGKKTGSDIQRVTNEEPVPNEPDGLQFRTPRLDSPSASFTVTTCQPETPDS